MSATKEAKSLTVRLQPDLYEAATRFAHKQGSSLNALIQQGLEDIIRRQQEKEFSDAFDLLAQHPDECDVEYAFAA